MSGDRLIAPLTGGDDGAGVVDAPVPVASAVDCGWLVALLVLDVDELARPIVATTGLASSVELGKI